MGAGTGTDKAIIPELLPMALPMLSAGSPVKVPLFLRLSLCPLRAEDILSREPTALSTYLWFLPKCRSTTLWTIVNWFLLIRRWNNLKVEKVVSLIVYLVSTEKKKKTFNLAGAGKMALWLIASCSCRGQQFGSQPLAGVADSCLWLQPQGSDTFFRCLWALACTYARICI